jgi:hypothetical protein
VGELGHLGELALDNMIALLCGIKDGQFSMRCQWAASSGKDRAARFILEKRLQPIQIAGSADFVEAQRRLKVRRA